MQTVILDYETKSNIQETSIESYKQELHNNNIENQLYSVFCAIRDYPCSTMREISVLAFIPVHLVSARIDDLRKKDKIRFYNKRECMISGKRVMTWEIKKRC